MRQREAYFNRRLPLHSHFRGLPACQSEFYREAGNSAASSLVEIIEQCGLGQKIYGGLDHTRSWMMLDCADLIFSVAFTRSLES